MRRFGLSHLVCLLVLTGGRISSDSRAAELLRGPYLQSPTPNSITIRWRTDVATPSVVKWGPQTNDLSRGWTNLAATTEHEVRLTGLLARTRYYYTVGAPGQTLAGGSDCAFQTPPLSGRATPTRVWVIGDSGGAGLYGGKAAASYRAYRDYTGAQQMDVWLMLGDNAYDSGTDAEYQIDLFEEFPALLRQCAPWSTIGNHDADGVGLPYLDLFSFPTNGEAGGVASGSERYYSFDHGNLHFICLDSTTVSRATNGAMANWLRADLAATTSQWIIAFWHHAPYSKGSHDSDAAYETGMIEMRQNIVPLLEAGGVDLVLTGHSHNYERSYLLHGHYGAATNLNPAMMLDPGSGQESDTGAYIKPTSGPRVNQGTVYVTTGSASVLDMNDFGRHPAMFTDQVELGSVVLEIHSNRLDAAFLRQTGEIGDHFTLVKGPPESLRLLPLLISEGKVIVRWKSEAGQCYAIEQCTAGNPPAWQPASGPITATGATSSWTNDISRNPAGFYRVIILPTTPLPDFRGGSRETAARFHDAPQLRSDPAPKAKTPPDQPTPLPHQPAAVVVQTAGRSWNLLKTEKRGNRTAWTPSMAPTRMKARVRELAVSHTPWAKQNRLHC